MVVGEVYQMAEDGGVATFDLAGHRSFAVRDAVEEVMGVRAAAGEAD